LYEFTNVSDGIYTISFHTEEPAGGITLSDAYMIMLYLLNMQTFTPFQEIVADVNASGSVTWADYTEIVYSYLNQGIPFSGGDWVFETITVIVAGRNRDGVSTSGASTGDVNGTFIPPKYGNCFINDYLAQVILAEISSDATLNLETSEPVSITGMHMEFHVPEGITIKAIHSILPGIKHYQEGDVIRVTWMNTEPLPIEINPENPVIEVEVGSNKNTRTGEKMHLTLSPQSHFIGTDGSMLPFINLTLPAVQFEDDAEISFKETIYPNPFIAYATLEYDLPSDGNINIVITNNAGQVVNTINEYQEAGPHQLKIDGSEWPSGMYHFAIQFSSEKPMLTTGSMIKSK
jgi:hypothetical protein